MTLTPSSARWLNLWAAVVLLLATLCYFHRLVLLPTGLLVGPHNGGRNDLTANMLPARMRLSTELKEHGEVPLWQPYELAGIPWWGNPQSAMLYPANWLYLLTDHVALAAWLMAAHLWLGGFGVYLYGRKLGLDWLPAVLAGCGYLGAPYLIAQVCEGHYNQLLVSAWLPWVLIGFERLLRGERGRVAWLSLILAMGFFCGHVQELYYLLLILTFWLFAACLRPRNAEEPPRLRLLADWTLTGIATVGLTAVELIPIYAYTQQAVRSSGLDLESSARFSLDRTSFWQLFDPLIAGGPDSPLSSERFYWETVCHFGVALTLLAVFGLWAAWHRPTVKRLGFTVLGCVLFGLGTATFFFPMLFHLVPGIAKFRGSSRILMHLSLFVSLLAGFGLQSLLPSEESSGKHRLWPVRGLIVFSIAIVAFALAHVAGWTIPAVQSFSAESFQTAMMFIGAVGMLCLGVCAHFRQGTIPVWLAALAVVVVVSEHTRHAHAVLRVVPADRFRGSSDIVRFLQEHAGHSRILANQELLSDWEAWRHGLFKVHGYEPVPPVRSVVLIDALTAVRSPQDELIGLHATHPADYRQDVLNLAAVKYAVIPAGGPKLPAGWQRVVYGEVPPTVQLTDDLPNLRYEIWENTQALARAFVLGPTMSATATDPTEKLMKIPPREAVMLSQDVLPDGPRQTFRAAEIVEFSANQITIEAQLDAPGYLVLSDIAAPGWRAEVNGRPQAVLPVNVIFRGVPLPAGSHRVRFTYTPPGWWLGVAISSVAWMIVLVGFAASFKRQTEEAEA